MEVPASSSTPVPSQEDRATADSRLRRLWDDPPGFLGIFMAIQNDALGKRIMATAFSFFLLGGINALLLRTQLAVPENTFLSPEVYNQLFTMHGSTMMYLFAVPMLEGFAIMVLPMMLGNREMPFPRLGSFSFWIFLLGGLLFYSSFLFRAVPDTGWFAYVPLSGPYYSPGLALDFWLLALGVAEIGAIAMGIEIVIAVLRMRAPGMSISRMPLFAWAMLITAFAILFAFTTLLVGSGMMEFDRKFGTQFFNPDTGGNPILWEHLFWIFGHPEVYIQFMPAAGMLSMIVPTFSRRPVVGYSLLALSLIATGFVSFGLWAHHMFTVGMPQVAMTFFSLASITIAVPSGIQVLSWITTIWSGRPQWKTPLLFVFGFLVIFVLGGITGVMVASVPFDWQVHDSYFVVAHFHYVLIGGVTFPIFAALYYWMPMFTGKMLNERLGKLNFWLMFIGFNVTFFPQHIVGLMGMPRRVYTYEAGWGWTPYNLISTIGAFILAAGVLTFLINLIYSRNKQPRSEKNPWGAGTLEWAGDLPPVSYGFAELPVVHSRYPLWEKAGEEPQEQLPDEERTRDIVRGMSGWPLTWRAAMITSLLDGRPQEIFRVSTPSIWPFVTAIGLVTIFAAEIFTARWLVASGALIMLVGMIAWNWPDPAPTSEEEEEAFEERYQIPVHTGGSYAVTRGAMALLLLVLGVMLGVMIFSYFYIRLDNSTWPLGNIENPSLLLPGIAALLLATSAGLLYWATRRIKENNQSKLKIGLAAAFLVGAVALGITFFELSQLNYDWTHNAYASIYWLIAGFLIVLLGVGLVMSILVQLWSWQGQYSARRHAAVENLSLFWGALLVFWLIGMGIITLVPWLS